MVDSKLEPGTRVRVVWGGACAGKNATVVKESTSVPGWYVIAPDNGVMGDKNFTPVVSREQLERIQ